MKTMTCAPGRRIRNLFPVLLLVWFAGNCFTSCENPTDSGTPAGGGNTEKPSAYTVTYNVNGGNGIAPEAQTVSPGGSVVLAEPGDLGRTGYSFDGWSIASSGIGSVFVPGASYTPIVNVTLYAKWKIRSYSVRYDANGGDGTAPETQTAFYGYTVMVPGGEALSKAAGTFNGWNTKADGTGVSYLAGSYYTLPALDAVLYARWQETPQYTVAYSANGGLGAVPDQIINAGLSLNLDLGTGFFRGGYTLSWWNTSSDLTGVFYEPGQSYTPLSDTTMYAKWAPGNGSIGTVHVSGNATGIIGNDDFIVPNSSRKGVFIAGRTVTLDGFYLAQYETTFDQWTYVKTWAEGRGYTFANPGSGSGAQPVANISWNDAIVWCNALSEMNGLGQVYTYNGVVIKDASNGAACDGAVMDRSKTGYRLPTEAEWEYAARGGDPSNTENWNYPYSGTSSLGLSGWLSPYYSSWWDAEWIPSDGRTRNAGGKMPNLAGAWDMTGNVGELCWDRYNSSLEAPGIAENNPEGPAEGDNRVHRGGDYTCNNLGIYGPDYAHLGYRRYIAPTAVSPQVGFRVVRK